MIKASALYIVIIIAFTIAVLCSSMIVSAYYYRLQYQKKFRKDILYNNIESGVNVILTSDSNTYYNERIKDLYQSGYDSISLKVTPWGVYDIGVVRAFIQGDTLSKAFSMAYCIDSTRWSSIYLSDEERPLQLSGHTKIIGTAFLPKAGVNEAFVEGKSYEGDKRLIIGKKKESKAKLPSLSASRLKYLSNIKQSLFNADTILPTVRNYTNSFLSSAKIYHFKSKSTLVKDINLKGNIVLFSNSLIVLDSSSTLDNVLVFAKGIVVKSGFKGRCQLFATDSVSIGKNCNFTYPSTVGVLKLNNSEIYQSKIVIKEGSMFNGILFTSESKKSDLQTLIDIGKKVRIKGQVFAQGLIRLKDSVEVKGNISANRFIYETNNTMFENYLVNAVIDEKSLSAHYLTSSLFWASSGKKRILQWMETK